MASVNKVILIGNLGKDPEVRYMPNGAAVANFSIATSRRWKDKHSGERQEETEWHRVVAYERTAEVVGEYLKKGQPVYVEGRIKTRKYNDKEGVTRYSTEIIVEQLTLLGSREDSDGGRAVAPAPAPARAAAPATSPYGVKPQAKTGTGFDDMDDDIPF